MKKTILLILLSLFFFTGCDPMQIIPDDDPIVEIPIEPNVFTVKIASTWEYLKEETTPMNVVTETQGVGWQTYNADSCTLTRETTEGSLVKTEEFVFENMTDLLKDGVRPETNSIEYSIIREDFDTGITIGFKHVYAIDDLGRRIKDVVYSWGGTEWSIDPVVEETYTFAEYDELGRLTYTGNENHSTGTDLEYGVSEDTGLLFEINKDVVNRDTKKEHIIEFDSKSYLPLAVYDNVNDYFMYEIDYFQLDYTQLTIEL